MVAPEDLAAAEAAFQRGYEADRLRQQYYQANAGVPCGWDPPLDSTGLAPAGLGYSRPPRADAVYEGPQVGANPVMVPTPEAFDLSAPASVTGSVHHWGQVPGPDVGGPGGGIVYAGLGDGPAPPRRSLLQKLLGRRG
jgi:hypothetical protein